MVAPSVENVNTDYETSLSSVTVQGEVGSIIRLYPELGIGSDHITTDGVAIIEGVSSLHLIYYGSHWV